MKSKTGPIIAASMILAFLLAGLYVNIDQADEDWVIPPWKAGDRVQWERISYDRFTGEVSDRTTSEWELVGPVSRLDGDGVVRDAYRWSRLDLPGTNGYDWYSLDLERGISFEFYWPLPSDQGAVVEFSPGKVLADGAALQGRRMHEGMEFHLPVGYLGGTSTFKVVSVQEDELRVEASRKDVPGVPYQSLSAPPAPSEVRYVYQYERGVPYPSSITVFDQEYDPFAEQDGTRRWVKVAQKNLLSADFSGTVDEASTNVGVDTPVLWRESARAAPVAEASFLDATLDDRLPVAEVLRAARDDAALNEYLARFPTAHLVDVATATLEGDQEETVVWNLTWADQETGRWYSFVRARTVPAQGGALPDLPLDEAGPSPAFGPWRTGGFHLVVPWLGPSNGPQLTLQAALSLLAAHAPGAPHPVFARWGPLVTEADQKPVTGPVHFVAATATWAIAVGDLGYRRTTESDVSLFRDLDTLWILGDSGTVAMTAFAEPFPSPGP